MSKFIIISSSYDNSPSIIHDNFLVACQEATRLAETNIKQKYIVAEIKNTFYARICVESE